MRAEDEINKMAHRVMSQGHWNGVGRSRNEETFELKSRD